MVPDKWCEKAQWAGQVTTTRKADVWVDSRMTVVFLVSLRWQIELVRFRVPVQPTREE
jgi:hypothetical protein